MMLGPWHIGDPITTSDPAAEIRGEEYRFGDRAQNCSDLQQDRELTYLERNLHEAHRRPGPEDPLRRPPHLAKS